MAEEQQRLHLDVAFEREGHAIRGTVDDNVGPVIEFAGWLELMSAFDTAWARMAGRARDPDLAE